MRMEINITEGLKEKSKKGSFWRTRRIGKNKI